MVSILSNLTGMTLPRLGQEPAVIGGIKSFLEAGAYRINFPDPLTHALDLVNFDNSQLINYLAFDFERFAFSSLETFATYILENSSKSLVGWPLLKLYYSAFFAAHALMRSHGAGVVNFDTVDLRSINSVIQISDPTRAVLAAGTYVFQINRASPAALRLQPMTESGGVHEAFWKYFVKYLNEIAADAVTKGQPDAKDFLGGVTEITDVIKKGKNGSVWLSSMRNEINYQHKYGVWHPVKKGDYIQKSLPDFGLINSSAIRFDYSKIREPLNAFASTSRYLACLNYEIGTYLAERSTSPKGFGSKWRKLTNSLFD